MTVPGYSMCRYDIVWERYCHKSVNNFIKETKTSVSSSLSKGSPTKLIEHCCNTRPIIIITGRPACRSSLDFLKLEFYHQYEGPKSERSTPAEGGQAHCRLFLSPLGFWS